MYKATSTNPIHVYKAVNVRVCMHACMHICNILHIYRGPHIKNIADLSHPTPLYGEDINVGHLSHTHSVNFTVQIVCYIILYSLDYI